VKILKILILALALTAFAAGSLWAAGPKPQTTCPVLGGNVDKNVYADYQGKRIYFCCQGCDAEFKKDPEKYMKKLKDEGVTLEPAPAGAQKK
jgi:YHS domain-containing protein